MVDAVARKTFDALQQDEANRECFDSSADAPTWASVSHGIFLSIGASGVHRSLGVKVSFVQSTTMDSWKPLHLRMMELGGNRRFQEFLESCGIPRDVPIREKYQTRAAAWYRENLRAEAEGSTPPSPLPEGTGCLPLDDARTPEQLMLDSVFAKAPRIGEMSQGGVHMAAALSSRRATKERARRCRLDTLMRSGRAHMANASSIVAELHSLVRQSTLQASEDFVGMLAQTSEEVPKAAVPGGFDSRSRSRSRSLSPETAAADVH